MVQAFSIDLPRQRELIGTWIILPSLSTMAVVLRLCARWKTGVTFRWSEWLIVVSSVSHNFDQVPTYSAFC